eukprot:COSAG02_NODE_1088_length_14670_cov_237.088326_17_plen_66_part_00
MVLKNDESEKGQEAFKVYEKERDMYNEKYQNMMKAHRKIESHPMSAQSLAPSLQSPGDSGAAPAQ